jgi:hypothetical protein
MGAQMVKESLRYKGVAQEIKNCDVALFAKFFCGNFAPKIEGVLRESAEPLEVSTTFFIPRSRI